jgi:hypothetical protein
MAYTLPVNVQGQESVDTVALIRVETGGDLTGVEAGTPATFTSDDYIVCRGLAQFIPVNEPYEHDSAVGGSGDTEVSKGCLYARVTFPFLMRQPGIIDPLPTDPIMAFYKGLGLQVSTTGVPAAAAGQTLTGSGTFSDGETITIGSVVGTMKTALTGGGVTANEILIGADLPASLVNLKKWINHESGAGTNYGSASGIHPTVTASGNLTTTLVVTAKVAGTAGNSIATTETAANASWGAVTLAGGTDDGQTSSIIFTEDVDDWNQSVMAAVDVNRISRVGFYGKTKQFVKRYRAGNPTECEAEVWLLLHPVYTDSFPDVVETRDPVVAFTNGQKNPVFPGPRRITIGGVEALTFALITETITIDLVAQKDVQSQFHGYGMFGRGGKGIHAMIEGDLLLPARAVIDLQASYMLDNADLSGNTLQGLTVVITDPGTYKDNITTYTNMQMTVFPDKVDIGGQQHQRISLRMYKGQRTETYTPHV